MSEEEEIKPLETGDKSLLSRAIVTSNAMNTRLNRVIKKARYNRWCIFLMIFCIIALLLVLIAGLYNQRVHCDENYQILSKKILELNQLVNKNQ